MRRSAGVVEGRGRVPREVSGVDSFDLEEMCLEKGSFWHHKCDVVDASNYSASVGSFAGRAGVDSEPNCKEERAVHRLWDFCGIGFGVEAAEGVGERVGHGGGVAGGGGGESGGGGGERAGVVERGGGG